jgi:hypothetical protein
MSFEEIAKMFLGAIKSDTDTYSSIKGEIVKNGSSSFSLLTPDHIQYARYGRGKGKNPPLEAMLQFIRSKDILFDGMDERGTAFAMQAIIAKKGTKNFVPNAPDFMEETISKYQKEYEEEMGKFISVEYDNKLKDELNKIWAEEERLLKEFKI